MDDNGFHIRQEEILRFYNEGKLSPEARRRVVNKYNANIALRHSVKSSVGRELLKDLSEVLTDLYSKIVDYEHNENISIEQNYHNILSHIAVYKSVQTVGDRWVSAINSVDEAIRKMKEENTKI